MFGDIKDLFILIGGIIGGLLVAGIIISVIFSFVYSFVKTEVYTDDIFFHFIKLGLLISFLLGVIVSGGILCWISFKNKKERNKKMDDLKKTMNREKENLVISLQNTKLSLKDNESTLKRLIEQTDSIVLTYNKNLSVYKQTVEETSVYSKIVYDSLVLEYNSTLNSSEWKNLDLIIYYFETGRAESIKEALQLMDKQLQHEELLVALKDATNSICGSIENSINYLKEEMKNCFEKLTVQIEINQKETIERLSKIEYKIDDSATMINRSVQMLNYNISEIISQERMHSALLSKINVGSDELVNDANYMLNYTKTSRV